MILREDTAALEAVYKPLSLRALNAHIGWGPPLTWDQWLMFQLSGAQINLNGSKCNHPRTEPAPLGIRSKVMCVACHLLIRLPC